MVKLVYHPNLANSQNGQDRTGFTVCSRRDLFSVGIVKLKDILEINGIKIHLVRIKNTSTGQLWGGGAKAIGASEPHQLLRSR